MILGPGYVSFKDVSELLKENYDRFYKIIGTHKYRDLFYANSINAFLGMEYYADFSSQKHSLTFSDFFLNTFHFFSDDIEGGTWLSKGVSFIGSIFVLLGGWGFKSYGRFLLS